MPLTHLPRRFLLLVAMALCAALGAADISFTDPVPQVEGTDITVVLTRSDTNGSVDVNWSMSSGTATAGVDCEALGGGTTGTATFLDGFDTALIIISTASGDGVEGTEDFTIGLDPVGGYDFVGTLPMTGTILDGDGASLPVLSIDPLNITVAEGGSIDYTVTALPPPASPLVVPLIYLDGPGVGSPGDYTGPATVTVGTDGIGTFTVDITSDAVAESNEALAVTLDAGAGWTLAFPTSFVTIVDTPVLTLGPTGAAIIEGGAAVELTVTATPAPLADLVVPLDVTGSGAADATVPATVTITASGTATISVSAPLDGAVEFDEVATISLGTGSGWLLGVGTSSAVTITDATPEVSFASTTAEATEGGSALISVTCTPAPGEAIVVPLTYAGATGDVTGPATVTVGTDGTGSFSIAAGIDALVESDETVTVTLNAGATWAVSATALTMTVHDGAAPTGPVLTLSADSLVLPEGEALELTVTASPAPSAALAVPVTYSLTGLTSQQMSLPTTVAVGTSGTGTLRITSNAPRATPETATCTVSLTDGATWDLSSEASLVLVQEPLSRVRFVPRITRVSTFDKDQYLAQPTDAEQRAYLLAHIYVQTTVELAVDNGGSDLAVDIVYHNTARGVDDVHHLTLGAGQPSVTLEPELWRASNRAYVLSGINAGNTIGGYEEFGAEDISVTMSFTDPVYGAMRETYKLVGRNGRSSDYCGRGYVAPSLKYSLTDRVGGAGQAPPEPAAPESVSSNRRGWLPLVAIAGLGWTMFGALALIRRRRR